MGIITNQAIRGNLTFGEGKAILSGKNSKGVATRLHITGDLVTLIRTQKW